MRPQLGPHLLAKGLGAQGPLLSKGLKEKPLVQIDLNLLVGHAAKVEPHTLSLEKAQAISVRLIQGHVLADLLFPRAIMEIPDIEHLELKP